MFCQVLIHRIGAKPGHIQKLPTSAVLSAACLCQVPYLAASLGEDRLVGCVDSSQIHGILADQVMYFLRTG